MVTGATTQFAYLIDAGDVCTLRNARPYTWSDGFKPVLTGAPVLLKQRCLSVWRVVTITVLAGREVDGATKMTQVSAPQLLGSANTPAGRGFVFRRHVTITPFYIPTASPASRASAEETLL